MHTDQVSVSTESHVSVVYLKVTTKAVARSHVRDCDSGTVRNFLEDDRHGVGRVGPSIQEREENSGGERDQFEA